jgi:ketosteroid isomerase-like protein
MDIPSVTRTILEMERLVLDAWSSGDPNVLGEGAAADVTYFDDIGAQERVQGALAFRAYLRRLDGHIPPHSYEIVDPVVQVYGDVAVLSLRYHAVLTDGTRLAPWKASEVFHRNGSGWQLVHSHWSMTKLD